MANEKNWCRTCAGTGKVKCRNCQHGWIVSEIRYDGLFPQNSVCSVCQGTTFAPCSDCNGMGYIEMPPKEDRKTCPICDGTGLTMCIKCFGKGYFKSGDLVGSCDRCYGKGGDPCFNCGGKGYIIE